MSKIVRCISFLDINEIDLIKAEKYVYSRDINKVNWKMIPERSKFFNEKLECDIIWGWLVEGTKWSEIKRIIFNMYDSYFCDRAMIVFDMSTEDIYSAYEDKNEFLDIDYNVSNLYPIMVKKIAKSNIVAILEPSIIENEYGKYYYSGGDISCSKSNIKLGPYYTNKSDVLFKANTALEYYIEED